MTFMVMNRITGAARARRIGVAEVKAHLSETMRDLSAGPVVIHSRGRDVAVLLSIEDFDALSASGMPHGGAALLERIARVKEAHGGGRGGGEHFEPTRLSLRTTPAFRGSRAPR
jgi:prevent-host-death family protein